MDEGIGRQGAVGAWDRYGAAYYFPLRLDYNTFHRFWKESIMILHSITGVPERCDSQQCISIVRDQLLVCKRQHMPVVSANGMTMKTMNLYPYTCPSLPPFHCLLRLPGDRRGK